MSQKPQGTRFHVEGDERYMEVPVYDQAEGSREQLVTKLLIGSGVAGVVLLVAGLQFSNNLLIVAGGILIALLYIVALKSIAKQKHYKAVRIHTDEIQLWDGYELEWAIPTSQLASVDIDTKVLWTIRTYDGRQFQFYLLPASLPDWSAAIRTLAPHAWPQGKGRRLWERVSVYRGKWMLLIGTLLMMPAAFLVAWAAVVALCLGSLIAGVGILLLAGGIDYRRELESESKQGKLSAEDMLRVWPIMDSEVKVYSYSDPRRLLLRSRRFSFGIWVFRILGQSDSLVHRTICVDWRRPGSQPRSNDRGVCRHSRGSCDDHRFSDPCAHRYARSRDRSHPLGCTAGLSHRPGRARGRHTHAQRTFSRALRTR